MTLLQLAEAVAELTSVTRAFISGQQTAEARAVFVMGLDRRLNELNLEILRMGGNLLWQHFCDEERPQ